MQILSGSAASTHPARLDGDAPPAPGFPASSSTAMPCGSRPHGRPKQNLPEFVIRDEMDNFIGVIKVDLVRKSFNAHCCQLGPPAIHDHRTPTMPECRLNRVGTKKPLGYLIQWLRQSSAFDDREEHKGSADLINRADRVRCREWLRGEPSLERIMQYEAEWNDMEWSGPGTVKEEDE